MEGAIVFVALIGFVAFRQWLHHQRRVLQHQERMAAMEKGIALPPVEQEVRRSGWNVQRLLLLAGLVWIALGMAMVMILGMLVPHLAPPPDMKSVPPGLAVVGFGPIFIGVAHLITYWVGARREKQGS